jgi:hypothetical protein
MTGRFLVAEPFALELLGLRRILAVALHPAVSRAAVSRADVCCGTDLLL